MIWKYERRDDGLRILVTGVVGRTRIRRMARIRPLDRGAVARIMAGMIMILMVTDMGKPARSWLSLS